MSDLEVKRITKSFNGKPLLTDISLGCKKGEVLGIYGRNGTGKSTLFKILFGTLKADHYEVYINQQATDLSKVIATKKIAYLHQDDFLPWNTTVNNLIRIYFEHKATQNSVFSDHRIEKIRNQKVGQLSSGERRYLEVLLIAHSEHEFIMLDEPFSQIEPLFKEAIKELLMKVKSHKGIILTDHYYRDVFEIADKNVLIKNGVSVEVSSYQDLAQKGYIPASQV